MHESAFVAHNTKVSTKSLVKFVQTLTLGMVVEFHDSRYWGSKQWRQHLDDQPGVPAVPDGGTQGAQLLVGWKARQVQHEMCELFQRTLGTKCSENV